MCVCVRRMRGAVGVKGVSCWRERDKNLFPLLKPSTLSEACVLFYEATHTHLQNFGLKIEKVGAHKGYRTGHGHFSGAGAHAPQPLLLSVSC